MTARPDPVIIEWAYCSVCGYVAPPMRFGGPDDLPYLTRCGDPCPTAGCGGRAQWGEWFQNTLAAQCGGSPPRGTTTDLFDSADRA